MTRIFVYDNREFPDPDPKMSVEEVRQSMTNFFPELSNAETKQTKRKAKPPETGEDDIITFTKRVGTKGRSRAVGPLKAEEELRLHGIERCPECNCSTGSDTEYKDFSNKYIIVCAQCGYLWYMESLAEDEVKPKE
ncbi:hypothetical protein LCGC14_1801210 [marine sediment metagenome]|uniref:Uncharacterized protein n=1 Tax=marine sediment metagenome TaxID=412755 RepID=A0A0F9GPS9_9ZZZZ